MARKVKDGQLDTRQARSKLDPRGKPYYRAIDPGLHLGYRKLKGTAGTWLARHYLGGQAYEIEKIGTADDISDADGVAILTYWQAQEAARKQRQRRSEAASGKVGPYTVKEAVEDYLTWLEANRKDRGDSRYKAGARILPVLGEVDCAKLTTEQIEKWFHSLANAPALLRSKKGAKKPNIRPFDKDDPEAVRKRRASANRIWTILRAALNRAWSRKKIVSDDAWRRIEPFEEADAARIRYLSIAESQRLVNGSEGDFRKMVQAALVTGARYGELARLRASDFNPDSQTIHVRTSKSGKGRHIVLNDEGAALFRALAIGKAGTALLLPREDGTAWGDAHQIRPMNEACKRAKISPPISFHGLRHTYASLVIMNGAPLMVVAKNLGHSDTRMVEKHYGHLAPGYVAKVIRESAPTFGIKADTNTSSLDEQRTKGAARSG